MAAIFVTFSLAFTFVAGALLVKLSKHRHEVENLSLSMALGAMVAIAALDLIPEIMEEVSGFGILFAGIFTAVGILLLVFLDHFIPEHEGSEESEEGNLVHIGTMAAVALVLHNIVEGMTVYNVAALSLSSGISLAVGVGLHNIPMGMFLYFTLSHEGKNKRHLTFFLAGFSTFFGGILMHLVNPFLSEAVVTYLTSVALGMVIYILCFELIPSVKENKGGVVKGIGIVLGFLIVVLSMLFE